MKNEEESDALAPVGESERYSEIARRVSGMELRLEPTDIEVPVKRALRIRLDDIPALGAAFATMPSTFRTIAGSISVPTLLQATDKFGNPIDPAILQSFKDGSGLMGSYRDIDPVKAFDQARLHTVGNEVIQTTSSIPYNPEMLFVAAEMMVINKKLDSIEAEQKEMFEYMRLKDKAKLRTSLKTLADLFDAYCYNWNNETWRNNAHMMVIDIKRDTDEDAAVHRAQILGNLDGKGPVESRMTVAKRLEGNLDDLKEYQLDVYVYSFASFLEPLFSKNLDELYIMHIANDIERQQVRYREIFTKCYDAIESSADSAIDAAVLRGLADTGKMLGSAIAKTPVGDRTPIDEALQDASKGLGEFSSEQTEALLRKLREAKAPNVIPFKETVETLGNLYNEPVKLLADSENIYLLQEKCE